MDTTKSNVPLENDYTQFNNNITHTRGADINQRLYKFILLGSDGKIEKIIVFSKGKIGLDDIFSNTMVQGIKDNDIPIVFADYMIHKDDNISTIKKKLILTLGKKTVAYDELYMFINVEEDIKYPELFGSLTKSGSNEVGAQIVERITHNYNIAIPPNKNTETYTYNEFVDLFGGRHRVVHTIPFGLKPLEKQDNYLFSGYPFIRTNDDIDEYKMAAFENELLMSYPAIIDNTVYFTTASNLFKYIDDKDIDRELFVKAYFPFLYKSSILTYSEFTTNKQKLIEKNNKILDKNSETIYKSIDVFYETYYERKSDLKYLTKGIKNAVLKIKSNMNIDLQLDVIFKNLHSTKNIPFIKYNSGSRQENIYRLYTQQKTNDGKFIPYLPEAQVIKLSREIGKPKQISLYIQENENQPISIVLSILNNGDLIVSLQLKFALDYNVLNNSLISIINPITETINGYLEKTGYAIPHIRDLMDDQIEVIDMEYYIEYNLEKEWNLSKMIGCITSIFDVKSNAGIEGSEMVFKRVENYNVMDAQQQMIKSVYDETGDYGNVVYALIMNYKLTQQEADNVLLNYLNEHREIQGRFIDNPGFKVSIQFLKNDNNIAISIKNVSSMKYIETLNIYFDSILRITQEPKTIANGTAGIFDICKKATKVDKDIDKPHIENMITNTIVEAQVQKPKIQPIAIALQENIDVRDSDDEDSGVIEGEALFFDNDEDEDRGVIEGEALFFDNDDEDEGDRDVIEGEALFFDNEEEEEEDSGIIEGDALFFDNEEDEDEKTNSSGRDRSPRHPKYSGGDGTPDSKGSNYIINPALKKMKLKDPYWIYSRLVQRDPKLFSSEEAGDPKYEGYSRICASNIQLQPVVLNQKEFEKQDPKTYNDYVKYGTDPDNPNYYICPRYWCLLNNTAMTKEDVEAGKCAKQGKPDKVIPRGEKFVPPDAFVYEFNNPKQHMDDKGNYRLHYPGFKVGKHPKGYALPCCFIKPKQNWEHNLDATDDDNGKKKKVKRKREKNLAYIISNETFPIKETGRYGYLPMSVQKFLQHDNNKCSTEDNAAIIKSETDCLLRYGVEQVKNQSFLGAIAEFYSYKNQISPVISVADFKAHLTNGETITLDKYVRYFNGYLVSVFRPKTYNVDSIEYYKYEDTRFYKSIDLHNEYQVDFLEDTIASYENFMRFLQGNGNIIDHTYLWDIVTNENQELFKEGLNLVILEIVNNDITNNIKVVCPTHSNNKKYYDPRKETLILIKYDDYYEPLYMYNEKDGKITTTRSFNSHTAMKNIKHILNIIEKTNNKYCVSHPSLPKVYKFIKNIGVEDLFTKVKTLNYNVVYQVLNYQGKVIGIVVSEEGSEQDKKIYVPCYPSAQIQQMDDIEEIFINETADIWTDYNTTIQMLNKLHNESSGYIHSKPVAKVVDDGIIVGVLTQTNQFVMITPSIENTVYDDLIVVNSSNYIIADKVVNTTKTVDNERVIEIKKIELETQFYYLFRSIIRELLGKYENKEFRDKIVGLYSNNKMEYTIKLKNMIKYLSKMVNGKIEFAEFDENVLMGLDTLKCSLDKCGNVSYCFKKTNEDNSCVLVIPKYHLSSGADNKFVYYARVADELLRYKRIRLFMLQQNNYLNITDTNYKLDDDEFILLQSNINNGYLKGLVPYNTASEIVNTAFNTAGPQISQKYSEEQVSIEEQYQNNDNNNIGQLKEFVVECIKETRDVIGNPQDSMWKRMFPNKTREIVFKNSSNNCTFFVLIYIFQDKYGVPISVQKIKETIAFGYKKLLSTYKTEIYKTLRKQGKRNIVDSVEKKGVELDAIIMSEEYYLTDLDIWVFAVEAKMQICLFTKNKLKGLADNLEWLILNKQYNEKHYFIRSPPVSDASKYGAYNLIYPAYSLAELPTFENTVQNIVSGKNKDDIQHIQSIYQYLESV